MSHFSLKISSLSHSFKVSPLDLVEVDADVVVLVAPLHGQVHGRLVDARRLGQLAWLSGRNEEKRGDRGEEGGIGGGESCDEL